MKWKCFTFSFLCASAAFLVAYCYLGLFEKISYQSYLEINQKIIKFYGDSLRGNLFSGFLALGGFIFSLKAFILVTMKQNVYDSKIYEDKWLELNKGGTGEAYFSPLKELNSVLYMTVLLSILSAILNITIGLLPVIAVVYICIFSAFYATGFLILSLWLIKGNLDTWFEYLGQRKFNEKEDV